ncbi:MAG: O-antigen ligase family protein [Desulfosoma sp.]
MARWLVSLVVISFVCMLILAYSTESIGNIRFHYAVTRFTGWAKNPNQLALLLAPIPFIAADLGLRAKGANSAGWWAAATFIVMGGTATQSDALVVAWGSTVFFMAILILFFSARRGRRNSRWVVLGCILVLLIPIIAFLVESILNLELISLLYNSIRSLYEQNEQGHIRIILWENGMKAILSSPLVGLGPGSHSGLVGPYGGSEAHNSLIDWGASAGFLGIAAYLTLMASMFLAAIRRQRTMLALALYSLFIFSLFHYVLRHPFFWLTLATVRLLIEMPSNGIKGMRKNVRVKRFLAATPYKPQSSISHLL